MYCVFLPGIASPVMCTSKLPSGYLGRRSIVLKRASAFLFKTHILKCWLDTVSLLLAAGTLVFILS